MLRVKYKKKTITTKSLFLISCKITLNIRHTQTHQYMMYNILTYVHVDITCTQLNSPKNMLSFFFFCAKSPRRLTPTTILFSHVLRVLYILSKKHKGYSINVRCWAKKKNSERCEDCIVLRLAIYEMVKSNVWYE